jgi:hypothetical protein
MLNISDGFQSHYWQVGDPVPTIPGDCLEFTATDKELTMVLESMQRANTISGSWVSTQVRLPKYDQRTIIWVPSSVSMFISRFEEDKVGCNTVVPYKWSGPGPFSHLGHLVTHWMPIPETPKNG